MVIDCDSCSAAGAGCSDCVVSVLLGPPGALPTVDDSHMAAVQTLAASGLVPPLRLVSGG